MATVAQRVRDVRKRKGLTTQQLAERLQANGLPWERTTVVKFEGGRRQSVAVDELLALALALDVAPIHLLVPLDDRPYAITPTRTEDANDVRAWVRGEEPLPGVDAHVYGTEVSVQDMRWRVSGRRGYLADRTEEEQRTLNEVYAEQLEEMARRMRGQV
ncbi:helix-turn-helix domain-containing protein [Streptomyces erythrochromogenes]|uniref:helix-turn-helix domain-containing protein n=1 Tax=Streptomyces erythrochromogenes TaxID=285574 RepID=UPI003862E714|nr:helix-turn-helix domain-containing protein [Streptomyces erythrochromogenes]